MSHVQPAFIRNSNLVGFVVSETGLCSPVLKRETEVAMLIYAGSFKPCTHTNATDNTAAGKETDRNTDSADSTTSHF